MTDDPKDDDLPDFLDFKKRLPPAEYEAAIQKAREATERANRPARPPVAPKAEKPPTDLPKPALKAVKKLPVPPPKARKSVVAEKKQPEAVEQKTTRTDVQPIGKTPPAGASLSSPSQAAKKDDKAMATFTNKKTGKSEKMLRVVPPQAKGRGVTSPAPKKSVSPADARSIAKAVKAMGKAKANGKTTARTAVKGKTTAKKPVVAKGPRTPREGTMTVAILKLASRKQGVSRDELNELTKWTGAPWRWNFSNKYETGYCDRFGYKLTVREGKDGETRYHVTKK